MKFKVVQVQKNKPNMPYSHRVEFWGSRDELLAPARWIKARNIDCDWCGWSLYISEQDLTVFLLAWGEDRV